MHGKIRSLVAGLVIVCAWATVSSAQQSGSFPIQPKHSGSVSYISGGIGLDEREALIQMGKDYDLKLSFAVTSGNYLGDIAVEIRDASGRTLLEASSEGPWFFAKLPPGRYTVTVTVMGQTQRKSVQVGGRGQTVVNFFWK
jgi:hypothetical protein